MGNKKNLTILAVLTLIFVTGVYLAYRYRTPVHQVQIGLFDETESPDAAYTITFPNVTRMVFSPDQKPLSDLVYSLNSGPQYFIVTYNNGKKGDEVTFNAIGTVDELMSFYSGQKNYQVIKKYSNDKQGFVELIQGTTSIRVLLIQQTPATTVKVTIQGITN
ncbi:MAG: hypothetical protein WDN47_00430 [Candidatus Doudnabacteria bacterium]